MSFQSSSSEPRDRVLKLARERFLELGYSKVTMDELAEELGMSKKTIYSFFPSKRELLREGFLSRIKEVLAELRALADAPEPNSAEKLGRVLLFLGERLPRPSRAFLADVQRSAPDVWLEAEGLRREGLRACFLQLFQSARDEGTVREGVDPEFLVLMILTLLDSLVNPRVLSSFPLSLGQVVREIWKTICLGVLTDRGREAVTQLASEKSGI